MALSGLKVVAQLKATINRTLGDGAVPSLTYTKGLFEEIPSDANLLFNNGYAITTGSTQDIDLAGVVTDAFGQTMTFAKVYAVLVINTATVAGRNIQVGGDAASVPLFGAVADYVTVGPKGFFYLASMVDGYTVTGTTGDILQIVNSAGGQTITVHVAVLGKS